MVLLCSAAPLALSGAAWSGCGPATVAYRLLPGSTYEDGCFGGCACPVVIDDLAGTFCLEPIDVNGTFDTYAVTEVSWSTFQGTLTITGSGTLTVFSEFAVVQRLDLDLVVDGSPQHFDGDAVTPGQIFPDVDVTVSRFGLVCLDTALTIVASPVTPDLDGDGRVDVADLLPLLAAWGACPAPPSACAADLDLDGAVGVSDLLMLLASWS